LKERERERKEKKMSLGGGGKRGGGKIPVIEIKMKELSCSKVIFTSSVRC
jgi:hypothetical protein